MNRTMPTNHNVAKLMAVTLCCLLLALALSACATPVVPVASESAAGGDTELTPVTIAVGAPHVPVYLNFDVADALGYFTDQGLDVDLQFFDGGSDAAAALLRGDADFSGNAMDHVLEAQMAGEELRMLMNFLDHPCATLIVRSDLADEIQSPVDLAGRAVGITRLGSATHTLTVFVAANAGVSADDFTVVEVGAAGAMDALRNGEIHAAMGVAPYSTEMIAAGEAVVLLDLCTPEGAEAAIGGGMPFTGLLTRADVIAEQPDLAQRVVNALVKAQSFITDNSVEDIVSALPVEVTGEDVDTYTAALAATLPAFSQAGGRIDPAGLERLGQLHATFGTIDDVSMVDMDALYDNQFVEQAAADAAAGSTAGSHVIGDCPDLSGTWYSSEYEALFVSGDGTHEEFFGLVKTMDILEQEGCHFFAVHTWDTGEVSGDEYVAGVINPDGNWITMVEVGETPAGTGSGRILGRLLDDHQMTWEYSDYSEGDEMAVVFSTILAREGTPLEGETCPDMIGMWQGTPFDVLNVYADGTLNQQLGTTNTLEVVHQENCHFRGVNSWSNGEVGGSEHVAGVLHSDGEQITILEVGEHPREGTRAFVRARLVGEDRLEWDYVGLSGDDAWKGQAFTTALTRSGAEETRQSCPELTGTWATDAWEGFEVYADGTHRVIDHGYKAFTIHEQIGCTIAGTSVYGPVDGPEWQEEMVGVINAEQGILTLRSIAPGLDGLFTLVTHRLAGDGILHSEYTGVTADRSRAFVYLLQLHKQDDAQALTIGMQPWIGYGPWWVADAKGLFAEYGLDVDLTTFATDEEVYAAMADGRIQAANAGNYSALHWANQGLDLQIVMLEDASYGADAIIAPQDVVSVDGLAGLRIAYEPQSVSDVLLNFALQQHGLSPEDVQPVPLAAGEAGQALLRGEADAAVTYEPFLSQVLAADAGLHKLFTAQEHPGLITDVLLVNSDYLAENGDTVRALLQVWDEAVAYTRENPDEAVGIIAQAMGGDPAELGAALAGLEMFDLAGNRAIFAAGVESTLMDGAQVALAVGLLDEIPDLPGLLAPAYAQQ